MHKIKNKKILATILAGTLLTANTVSHSLALDNGLDNSKPFNQVNDDNSDLPETSEPETDTPDDENNNTENENKPTEVLSSISDINDKNNLGKECSIKGTVLSFSDSVITAKDSSGEGLVYIDFDIPESVSIDKGDEIIAKGIIKEINTTNHLYIDDTANFTLTDKNTNDPDNNQTNKPDNNGNNQDKPNMPTGGNSNKPSINNQGSMQSITGGTNSNTTNVKTVSVRSYKYINYNLSDYQWELVKDAINDNKIKAVDLKNNTIRIKRVSVEYGDRVWIVKDPRNLYTVKEDNTKTIGKALADTINYEDYNISKSKWNTILENIENGSAKLKETSNGNLKVIYSKSGKSDSTIIITKK